MLLDSELLSKPLLSTSVIIGVEGGEEEKNEVEEEGGGLEEGEFIVGGSACVLGCSE